MSFKLKSDAGVSAVAGNRYTDDITCLVACEKANRSSNLSFSAAALDGSVFRCNIVYKLPHAASSFGFKITGADRIDVNTIDFSMPILLGYSGLSDLVLKKYVEDSRVLWQDGTDALDSTLLCSVIGTHTGPGVVAVAFFKKSSAR